MARVGGGIKAPNVFRDGRGQSRKGSLFEALINTAIGFIINFFANLLIFPLFGLHISPHANFLMGMIYTAISVARSYAIRRWFNALIVRAAQKLSGESGPQ